MQVIQINIKSIHLPCAACTCGITGQHNFPLKQGFSTSALWSFGDRSYFCGGLSWASWEVHNIPSCQCSIPFPNYNDPKCLETLPTIPRGAKQLLGKSHMLDADSYKEICLLEKQPTDTSRSVQGSPNFKASPSAQFTSPWPAQDTLSHGGTSPSDVCILQCDCYIIHHYFLT